MASMRDIKRRKESIQSTEQITKAMKLVATVKLQKSKEKAEASKAYFVTMYETVSEILKKSGGIDHRYLKANGSDRSAVIAITSNRGLAGGYNNNVIRMILSNPELKKENTLIFSVGKKGKDGLAHKGYEIGEDFSAFVEEPLYRDAAEITERLLKLYEEGKIGSIYLAFTYFKNTVVHEPVMMKLLPVDAESDGMKTMMKATDTVKSEAMKDPLLLMNYEPSDEAVLDLLIPKYLSSLIYGALLESVASENGARMAAMDSATNNADEMIEKLNLQYNRARQGSITQELTEIIAGANAIDG